MAEQDEIRQPDRPEIEQPDFHEFEQSTDHPQGDDTRVQAERIRSDNASRIY